MSMLYQHSLIIFSTYFSLITKKEEESLTTIVRRIMNWDLINKKKTNEIRFITLLNDEHQMFVVVVRDFEVVVRYNLR